MVMHDYGSAEVNQLSVRLTSVHAIERRAACKRAAELGELAAGLVPQIAQLAAEGSCISVQAAARVALVRLGLSHNPTSTELFELLGNDQMPGRAKPPVLQMALGRIEGDLTQHVSAIEAVFSMLSDVAQGTVYDRFTAAGIESPVLTMGSIRLLAPSYTTVKTQRSAIRYLTHVVAVLPPAVKDAISRLAESKDQPRFRGFIFQRVLGNLVTKASR